MGTSRIDCRANVEDETTAGSLPQVTTQERDFWRRAVAEERRRLELLGRSVPRKPQQALN